jgi:hypothetical protein
VEQAVVRNIVSAKAGLDMRQAKAKLVTLETIAVGLLTCTSRLPESWRASAGYSE